MEEVNPKITIAVENLKEQILLLKKSLHFSMVANDSKHNSSDMGAIMAFHSLYLQIIGYWIGLLDGNLVPKPNLPTEQAHFDKLTAHINNIALYNNDSKTLLYAMLFKYSIQHPFDLGEKINNPE
jgi:hypothetical protein